MADMQKCSNTFEAPCRYESVKKIMLLTGRIKHTEIKSSHNTFKKKEDGYQFTVIFQGNYFNPIADHFLNSIHKNVAICVLYYLLNDSYQINTYLPSAILLSP